MECACVWMEAEFYLLMGNDALVVNAPKLQSPFSSNVEECYATICHLWPV